MTGANFIENFSRTSKIKQKYSDNLSCKEKFHNQNMRTSHNKWMMTQKKPRYTI